MTTHRRHRGQRGFTLMEMVVTLTILGVLSGVVGASFSVGFKTLGVGGSGDRLAGAHDQMVFEQLLAKDVSRSACILLGSAQSYGSCSRLQAAKACSSTDILCVGWPLPDGSCRLAAYGISTKHAHRDEWTLSPDNAISHTFGTVITTDPVRLGVVATAANGWVNTLTVTVTSLTSLGDPSTHNLPSNAIVLRPLAADPDGPGAIPC
jgi:prepilin-type N-terminal cleavage/methylation domain-containing protein